MKKIIFLITIFSSINSLAASYISFTTKNTSKMELPKKINPMYKAMTSMMKDQVSEDKTYVSGKVKAIHFGDGRVLIFDYNKNVVININESEKKYTQESVKNYYKRIYSSLKKGEQSFGLRLDSFKSLKKMKKVSKKPCKLFSSKSYFSLTVGNVNQAVDVLQCVLQENYKAWAEISDLEKKAILPFIKKLDKKTQEGFKGDSGYDPLNGIRLYSKYSFVMDFSGMAGSKSGKMPPGMEFPKINNKTVSVVKSISEKPFSLSKLSIPKGYKKVKSL